ncbi:MAG: hypothetical protein LH645_05100 [Actinomycetia bacterium]|nr:hypothetical protein [Actinomycetes bacterium]
MKISVQLVVVVLRALAAAPFLMIAGVVAIFWGLVAAALGELVLSLRR